MTFSHKKNSYIEVKNLTNFFILKKQLDEQNIVKEDDKLKILYTTWMSDDDDETISTNMDFALLYSFKAKPSQFLYLDSDYKYSVKLKA